MDQARNQVGGVRQAQGVQSLEVGLALLRSFLEGVQPCSLSDLARRANMHRAKAYRYLVSLQRMGWVEQDPQTGLYVAGDAARDVALAWWRRQDLLVRAMHEASILARTLGETCFVALWRDEGATVVRVFQPQRTVAISVLEGSVLPAASSATGRLFALWRREAAGVVPPLAQKAIRSTGVSVVRGDHIAGINSVSAPVLDAQGNIVLALTLVGPEASLDTRSDGRHAAALRATCQALSLAPERAG